MRSLSGGCVSETRKGVLLFSTGALSSSGAYFGVDARRVNHAYPGMTPGPFFVLLCLKFTRGAGLGSSNSFHPMVCGLIRDGMWPLHPPSVSGRSAGRGLGRESCQAVDEPAGPRGQLHCDAVRPDILTSGSTRTWEERG